MLETAPDRLTGEAIAHLQAPDFVEVSARDGLQNETAMLNTKDKIDLIGRLVDAGATRLEVASFVHPKLVPQMADAEAVIAGLPKVEGVRYVGLVLNKRGAIRALETGIQEVGAVCCASDTFGARNQGETSDDTVDTTLEILRLCHDNDIDAQATIAVAFGCPFEGAVAHDRVVDIARRLAQARPKEIALADTIGVAGPLEVTRLVKRVIEVIAPIPLRLHFHDTRGMGIANAWAGVQAGARVIDASVGGLGGCPFAPGAAGNVRSEQVAYLFERSGRPIGIDLEKLVKTAGWIRGLLGKAPIDFPEQLQTCP